MIRRILPLLLLVNSLIPVTAIACVKPMCGGDAPFWPPSHCTGSVQRGDSGQTLTVTYEDMVTFAANSGSTPTIGCLIAVGTPEDSGIRGVTRVAVLDANGNPSPWFTTFQPNDETAAAFRNMIVGLGNQWTGYQAFLNGSIPPGERAQIVVEFAVNPRATQASLLKLLSSAVLAADAGEASGKPTFEHLGFGFGLGHRSLETCVEETKSKMCAADASRDAHSCSRQVVENCARQLGLLH
jgi:hypothetical protein